MSAEDENCGSIALLFLKNSLSNIIMKINKIRDENFLNISGRRGAKVCCRFVGQLSPVVQFLVDRLVHQCFCSRGTARGDDRASSLKKRVRYL